MKVEFDWLAIGAQFMCNGNKCTKKSTLTAWIDGDVKHLWFYFGLREVVKLGWN